MAFFNEHTLDKFILQKFFYVLLRFIVGEKSKPAVDKYNYDLAFKKRSYN